MSLLSKIVTGVFGKKSDKDIKRITPIVNIINKKYEEIKLWEEKRLKAQIIFHKNEIDNMRKNTKIHCKSENLSPK